MADNTFRTIPPLRSPAARGNQPASPAGAAGGQGRSAYQQRLEQIKTTIVEMSHRNMENTLRVLRIWMQDGSNK